MASRLSEYLRPTTLLQAINVLLEAISSNPVSSLEAADSNTNARIALKRIGETMREVLNEGWHWNEETEYELVPNTAGEINVPANMLRVVQLYTTDTYRKRLVWRGGRLYDRVAHSYNIATPVKVDGFILLDFEELPDPARWYVTLKAARRFSVSHTPSSSVYQFTKKDEDEARLRLEQYTSETDPDASLRGNPHVRRQRRTSA